MSRVRIVLGDGGALAGYPEGGGIWSCFLQYLFGLNALGHDVFWLEVLQSSGNGARDQQRIKTFFRRFKCYGFGDRCAVLLYDQDVSEPTLEQARAYGRLFRFMHLDDVVNWIVKERLIGEFRAIAAELGL